jgi:hypothetical protein
MIAYAARLNRPDPDLTARVARQHELGLDRIQDLVAVGDPVALELADRFRADLGIVNIVGQRQDFVGLAVRGPAVRDPGRTMAVADGYCPDVVLAGLPRGYDDTLNAPRTALSKPVAAFGARSYVGVPLKDTETGLTLATMCILSLRTQTEEQVDEATTYMVGRAPEVFRRLVEAVSS